MLFTHYVDSQVHFPLKVLLGEWAFSFLHINLPRLCTVHVDLLPVLWSSSMDKRGQMQTNVTNVNNVLFKMRGKEIRHYYYLHFLNGDWKPQLSHTSGWSSPVPLVPTGSLYSRWDEHCASIFWNWLRHFSVRKPIQGGTKRVFFSVTPTFWLWFAHSLAGQDWAARTDGVHGNSVDGVAWNHRRNM